ERAGRARQRLRRGAVAATLVVLAPLPGRRSPMRLSTLALSAVVLAVACAAHAAVFEVRPGPDSKVVFVSKAPTETFEGKTNIMRGTLTLDPGAIGDTITVHLEVDLASLDTGKKMRNQHMREEHLETDKYPKAIFDGAAVLSPSAAK